ncbi:unnamed protein product [Linum trigynum]|uniref:F-box domain-containing protein n=1 Tax=Linum trigynum TaxID=586398 RepID=A0AAV2EJY0_9ROSI
MAEVSTPFRKKLKTSHHQRQEIDVVSNLPDHILHYILSFLDMKLTVQTSIVSKRWRFLWTGISVLNFNRYPFRTMEGFMEHVGKLLSLRSKHGSAAAVSSISFDFGKRPGVRSASLMLDARRNNHDGASGSPGVSENHLYMAGHFKTIEMAASIMTSGGYGSLETLKLKAALLESAAFPLGFKFVTNLELHHCRFYFSSDPFADLPWLKYLKLHDCLPVQGRLLKVSVPQLLRLDIRFYDSDIKGIEVSALELKSFRFCGPVMQLVELNLPSLDSADIRLAWDVLLDKRRECMSLLRGLHNVKSLNLRFDKSLHGMNWKPREFPLTAMKRLMESENSHFTSLERLRVQYPQKPPRVPRHVLRYFLGSSPEGKSTKFKWHNDIKAGKLLKSQLFREQEVPLSNTLRESNLVVDPFTECEHIIESKMSISKPFPRLM